MSRSDKKIKELITGIHLVMINDVSLIPSGVRVHYVDGHNKRFDQDYSLDKDKIFAFNKMCAVSGIDKNAKEFKKECVGKRLWVAIKEVHDGDNIEYFIFDTIMCDDPMRPPIISGDPAQHPKGIPMGVFVEHKGIRPQFVEGGDLKIETKKDFDAAVDNIHAQYQKKADAIASAKEMIKNVESGKKNVKQEASKDNDWEDF